MSDEIKAPRKEDIRVSKTPMDFASLSVFIDNKPLSRVQKIQFLPITADQSLLIAEIHVIEDAEGEGSIFAIPTSKLRIMNAWMTSWRNNVARFTVNPDFNEPPGAPGAADVEDESVEQPARKEDAELF